MKIHITSTHGSEDPTRATFPWMNAKAAVEAGNEVTMSLIGDSVVVLRDEVADNIQGMGLPKFKEIIEWAKGADKLTVFA